MPKGIDRPLFYTLAALVVGGFLILASASVAISQKNFGTISYYTLRQFLTGGLGGILAIVITAHIPYRHWKKLSVPLMLISFLLLSALFIPEVGIMTKGARRWLDIGPVSFQPSEVLKFSFLIYLASWMDARKGTVASVAYGFMPFALMLSAVAIFLTMQPDIGMLGVITLSAIALYFLGGGNTAQIVTLCVLGAIVLLLLVQLAPYRLNRVLVFLNPEAEPQGIGYQINQALIAIGSGGFLGLGFGKGLQKFNYLPEPIGDSIFAIFAEELGFLGAILMIAMFLFFLWRGFFIARHAPDLFGTLLAAGITLSVTLQAFINMAAISGLLPLTGITLPFISYGGTSLVTTMAGMGILLNISRRT